MSTNQYGLDVHYFKKNLEKILLEIDCYTPEEMKLALSRLSQTASTAQLKHGLKVIIFRLKEQKTIFGQPINILMTANQRSY